MQLNRKNVINFLLNCCWTHGSAAGVECTVGANTETTTGRSLQPAGLRVTISGLWTTFQVRCKANIWKPVHLRLRFNSLQSERERRAAEGYWQMLCRKFNGTESIWISFSFSGLGAVHYAWTSSPASTRVNFIVTAAVGGVSSTNRVLRSLLIFFRAFPASAK